MSSDLTIRQLRAFARVAELGSFTRAAERLSVPQPALSVLIRDLEAALGTKLLDRTTRRVELTEAGQEFQAAAAKILADVDEAAAHARDRAKVRRGRLVVAAPPLLAAAILPGAIAEFRARFPGVTVVLSDTRPDLIASTVRAGEVHCGIGTFGPREDGTTRVVLARDRIVSFWRRERAPAETLRWRDLDGHPLIVLTRDSGVRALVERACEAAEIELRPAFEVAQVTTALALAAADLGVALLPAYAFGHAHGQGLVARSLADPVMERDLSVIFPSQRSRSPALDAFVDVLRAHTAAFGRSLPPIDDEAFSPADT